MKGTVSRFVVKGEEKVLSLLKVRKPNKLIIILF